ncbi:endonuclease 8-like 3 [Pipistrellus kuhlii]|uniref:Endonuclease 8-like 3 n=1 Tax=Pipistrellus kuhlii TaxID=59472 RepID=A0A7J7ZKR3_PIPKU|nr:endonuclease 8-like 3 [Pipistrellus kuhlii]KAF6374721.1 nei like DNA glycosylase 3 [Pipistrellus kuhlii]
MVEGPGCTLSGARIRARVRPGQAVRAVRGDALRGPGPRPAAPAAAPSQAAAQSRDGDSGRLLSGHTYSGVDTLGKELFLFFGPKALRVHFGMKGYVRINPPECESKNGVCPVLEVQLSEDRICFFDSSVELRDSAESQRRVRMMGELDVCSPKFNFSRAEREVRKQQGRVLCDVVMDQRVLPGVGNIIRNEALCDSGLHPTLRVCQLTEEQIQRLVKMTRDFSLLFYKCRKAGLAVSKHYKVYGRPHCGRCRSRITVCRLGENSRMTYFCPHCQPEDAHRADGGQLPTRNTAVGPTPHGDRLGDHVARRWEEAWACGACTLINMPSAQACDACLAPRPAESRLESEDSPAALSDVVRYPCSSFGKPSSEVRINRKTAFGTTTLVLTDLSQKPRPPGRERSPDRLLGGELQSPLSANIPLRDTPRASEERADSTTQPPSMASPLAFPAISASHRPACKRLKTAHSSSPASGSRHPALNNGEPQMDTTGGACASMAPAPRCSQHRRLCVLRVVRKDGENKGRPFYTCPLPREAQCGFFEWADLSFPFCDHGKRSILRTVLKMGPNNGKQFFVCPLGKEAQCRFFQWAAPGPE